MARHSVLSRLHRSLLDRKDELLKRIRGELSELSATRSSSRGDRGDSAFYNGSNAITSQLAQLETEELSKIDEALNRWKDGNYGTCDACRKPIPVARLDALPFSTMCVKCCEEQEKAR